MADHITIEPSDATWVVRAGGAVLGESSGVLILREGDYDPVPYFPRDDIAMAFLDRTDKSTHCPHKGDAAYYSIATKSVTIENAVWTYEAPKAGVSQIAGYLAFGSEEVAVEEL